MSIADKISMEVRIAVGTIGRMGKHLHGR